MWKTSKDQLSSLLEQAKTTLGAQVKDLDKVLKEVIKYMDKVVTDYIKIVQDYAKLAHNSLCELSKQYSK